MPAANSAVAAKPEEQRERIFENKVNNSVPAAALNEIKNRNLDENNIHSSQAPLSFNSKKEAIIPTVKVEYIVEVEKKVIVSNNCERKQIEVIKSNRFIA